jgi:hypothetical protein
MRNQSINQPSLGGNRLHSCLGRIYIPQLIALRMAAVIDSPHAAPCAALLFLPAQVEKWQPITRAMTVQRLSLSALHAGNRRDFGEFERSG